MKISETENPTQINPVADSENSVVQPTKSKWVIMFDEKPSEKDDKYIDNEFEFCTSKECEGKCNKAKRIRGKSSLIELWEFEGVETEIHNERIKGGVSSTNVHAELNFEIGFREEEPVALDLSHYVFSFSNDKPGKEGAIKIAVLDTGINTDFFPKEFLWKGDNGIFGRSFIKNGGSTEDDDENLHGTLVSSLILNQFKDHPVQIMNLKTHDSQGKGDLFAIMDAVCFAKEQGADIINASWGFYNKEDILKSYLKDMFTNSLKDEGILLITASGNKSPNNEEGQYFFPAGFGRGIPDEEKNIIVVTTLDKACNKVSATQNADPQLVDFGVPADLEDGGYYMFKLPFEKKEEHADPGSDGTISVSGTSFAAAVATGLIGNFLGKPNKGNLLGRVGGQELFGQNDLLNEVINGGRYLKRKTSSKNISSEYASLV